MPNYPCPITHILYDLDGLLLNTQPFYAQADHKLANRYGKTLNETVKAKITGIQAFDVARTAIAMLELPITPEIYLQQRQTLLDDLFPHSLPLPGAIKLTQHFHKHGIPQAIASSSVSRSFYLKTQNHQQWFSLFDCIVLGDDPEIKKGKPSPETFLLAAQRMGALPQQCLVFEDALAGVEAALAAGMSVVAVPAASADKNLYKNAHQIINSLLDFQPEYWHLPGF